MNNAGGLNAQAVDDTRLREVVGGTSANYANATFGEGRLEPYSCPACGGAIRFSSWLRYYCVSCDENWYDASALMPAPDTDQPGQARR